MDDKLSHPDAEAVEAGRLLFAGQCEFVAAANNLASLPPLLCLKSPLPADPM